ncbi:TadE family protein [Novipirellula herctigrandis]
MSGNRTGAALVEFAMVLPVMILFFTAMIEISRALMLQHTADTAAYEAARAAMVPGAIAEDAISEANQLLTSVGLDGTTVSVTPENIDEETGFITVLVNVPIAQNSWITPDFFTGLSVSSEVTLLTERSPIVRLTAVPLLKTKKTKMKGKGEEL